MAEPKKEKIAQLVRDGRTAKGYTQQELSNMAGVSLRSVQRIENAEVLPRLYTIKVLAKHLSFEYLPEDVETEVENAPSPDRPKLSKARKIILTAGIGVILLLGTGAYIAQAAKFPATDFERLLVWGGVAICYVVILFRIWK